MAINEQAKVVITAEDKASGVFEKVGSGFGKMGGVVGTGAKVVGGALAATAVAFTGFATSSLKAFQEAEQEMTVANQALANTFNSLTNDQLINLWGQLEEGQDEMEGLRQMMDNAGQSAIKLGFDDESASVAFAKLFQATSDVTQAQTDLKLAMDLSAFSGRSLEESTSAIMKVHAGGTKILKEFGIEVKDGTTATEALAIAQGKVAGSAEALAGTFGKQMEIMGIMFANLKEEVGGVLAEALMPLMEQVNIFVSDPRFAEILKQLAMAFAELLKAILPLVLEIMPLLIKLLQIIVPIITTVVGWIVQAIDAFKHWGENMAFAREEVMKLFEKLQPLIDKLIQMRDAAQSAFSAARNAMSNVGSKISSVFQFQSGGIVNAPLGSPVMAMVHGGERIIPNSGGYGGGGITVNILGGTYLSEDVALEIGNMIVDRLKLQIRV